MRVVILLGSNLKFESSMLSKLEPYRVREGLDVWVVPNFAQKVLDFDPAAL